VEDAGEPAVEAFAADGAVEPSSEAAAAAGSLSSCRPRGRNKGGRQGQRYIPGMRTPQLKLTCTRAKTASHASGLRRPARVRREGEEFVQLPEGLRVDAQEAASDRGGQPFCQAGDTRMR